jgi:hypothetical protein
MIGEDLAGDGRFETAAGFGDGTAGMKGTSFGRMNRGRDIAGQDDAAAAGAGVEGWHGGDQGLGIGVSRQAGDGAGRAGFDDVAEVHDRDAVAEMFDHGKVVSDEQVSQAALFLEILQEVDHLRLHGNIKRADRFIADDEARFDGEGAGNADALALAAAELVGITAALIRIESNDAEELTDPFAAGGATPGEPVDVEGFPDDRLDGEARIERAGGVLEDHLKLAALLAEGAAIEGEQVEAVESDLTAGGFNESDNGAAEGGFATTAFAHQPKGFAGRHLEVDPVDGLHKLKRFVEPPTCHREMDLKIEDFEEFHGKARA